MQNTKNQNIDNWVFTLLLILILVVGSIIIFHVAALVKESLIAMITLGAGLILAFYKHQLELGKDRETRRQLQLQDEESRRQALKQDNYKELLSNIAEFAMDKKKGQISPVSCCFNRFWKQRCYSGNKSVLENTRYRHLNGLSQKYSGRYRHS